MGYRGRADWRDMSDYVVHFTKADGATSAYQAMTRILADGEVQARNTFGCATNVAGLGSSQASACLSEIPLDMLDRLVRRRSRFGIGFSQPVVLAKGGGRVWYLDEGSPHRSAVYEMVRTAMTGGVQPQADIWKVTPFVDMMGPTYHFEWEREWRVPGGIRFAPGEVAFLFVPEELHTHAARFLATGGQGAGPVYAVPLLDPLWGDDRIQEALTSLPPQP